MLLPVGETDPSVPTRGCPVFPAKEDAETWTVALPRPEARQDGAGLAGLYLAAAPQRRWVPSCNNYIKTSSLESKDLKYLL